MDTLSNIKRQKVLAEWDNYFTIFLRKWYYHYLDRFKVVPRDLQDLLDGMAYIYLTRG